METLYLPAPAPDADAAPTTNAIELPVPSLDRLLAAFLSGVGANTLEARRKDVQDFAVFLGLRKESSAAAAKALVSATGGEANLVVMDFRSHLLAKGRSPSTINRKLSSLREVVRLGRVLGLTTNVLEVPAVKGRKYRDTKGPGDVFYRKMLAAAAAQENRKKAGRDTLVLRLLHDLALRRAEVAGLDLSDIDLDRKEASIVGKGRTERESVPLSPDALEATRAWIVLRGEHPGPLIENLDPGHGQGRLTPTSIYRMVRAIGHSVGVRTRPHGLRHSGITRAAKKVNGDMVAVAAFARHSNLNTTKIYLDNARERVAEVSALVGAAD